MATTHGKTSHQSSGQESPGNQGSVRDPEHDGRLKENREAGRTMGTTPGSETRAHEHGREPATDSHSGSHSASQMGRSHSADAPTDKGSHGPENSDSLKAREYKDAQGNVHHHTTAHRS